MTRPTIPNELAAIVGDAFVVVDPDLTARHRIDWTGRYVGPDAVVVRPGSTAEVAGVVAWAAASGVALVPQGGNTGLVGGSVPERAGSVVVSTERLVALGEADAVAGQVTVGAGVTPSMLADHVRGTGWRFAVDLGARDTATIGGMVATNAGGMRVFRHGSMRAQVLGLEYVTAAGDVVSRLGGLQKDNTGFDLGSLLCGSEGTLGIVTSARLRLIPDPAFRSTALLGFDSAPAARTAAWTLRRAVGPVEVIEYVSGQCVDLVATTFGLAAPFIAAHVLLVEAAADVDPTESVAAAIGALAELPTEVAVAADRTRQDALWRFRDDITAALATTGPVVKYDVSIPSSDVDAFRADAEVVVSARCPGATAWWFGHVCDDNLHLNVTGAPADPDVVAGLDRSILELVAAHGGSISAEHGIGRAKARYLHLSRSAVEIASMRAIKHALDPTGILNPGVLLP